jgi:ribonuclease T2
MASDKLSSAGMKKLRELCAGLVFLFAASALTAPPFDRYVLSLSWAPEFCALPATARANPEECAPGRAIGFVLHGLRPESADGKSTAACGAAKPVSRAVVKMMLRYMLTAARIQQEWAAHGVCTGLSSADYFGSVLEARTAVQIPVQITSLENAITESPEQIETQFAQANPAFPKSAFRTSCRGGALEEMRVCFDKTLKPQACPSDYPDCALAAIVIRPPR